MKHKKDRKKEERESLSLYYVRAMHHPKRMTLQLFSCTSSHTHTEATKAGRLAYLYNFIFLSEQAKFAVYSVWRANHFFSAWHFHFHFRWNLSSFSLPAILSFILFPIFFFLLFVYFFTRFIAIFLTALYYSFFLPVSLKKFVFALLK